MKVYALVGKSGTGKSSKAQYVAGLYDVEYIIDDGLLIMGNKVLTGISAKRENTRFAAVRRAIFLEEEHREMVSEALKLQNPESILILGTSQRMVEGIMKELEMGSEYTLINIEDVSTPEEIEEALKSRRQKGKHVIPVPTFEVRKDFSGYLLYSIRQLIKRDNADIKSYEKTVVRPTFSYLGRYDITPSALKTIISFSIQEIEELYKILAIDLDNDKEGIKINVSVALYLKGPLHTISKKMALMIKENVEYMTNINALEVNIIVRAIKVD